MILGTQWYILFSDHSGRLGGSDGIARVGAGLRDRGLGVVAEDRTAGVFPFYVTGAITASGGSWNASIVAEFASWGDTHLRGRGLGAYIAQATGAATITASCSGLP